VSRTQASGEARAIAGARVGVEALSKLTVRQQRVVLRQLTRPVLRALHDAWPVWAHAGQVPPGEGRGSRRGRGSRDWAVWLIRAGRGFGKTRAGAEWVHAYALRGGDPAAVAAMLDARFGRADALSAGDVVLMATGPGQLHFGVWTGEGLVHADAGLRRVVERPGVPPWPVLGMWRGD
jgi:hypothetical protein